MAVFLRSELAERWEAIYGVPPPKGARRVLLERAIAWHIQAKAFGGIKKETLRALLKAPTGTARTAPKRVGLGDRNAAANIEIHVQPTRRAGRPLPSTGARLVRDWHGKSHVVDVVQAGYVWQGKGYKFPLCHRACHHRRTLVGAKVLRTMSVTPRLRCAIYTRKSSEEGLEQDFNSLDAQREACEAFVASQVGLGWKLIHDRYDDGGISGGTLARPAQQRLLDDVKSGRYGTHAMRRTRASQIYKKTGNIRAVQLLLGHTKLESTVRYLGIEVDDALAISEQVEL